jgi:hypothetical protein
MTSKAKVRWNFSMSVSPAKMLPKNNETIETRIYCIAGPFTDIQEARLDGLADFLVQGELRLCC